ncbi:MAG: response regulator [Chloroflexi bacterium]|nr:response regulator [Chloroflexota bacterium]
MARVLIIEDEPEILDLLGDLLTLEGYDVHQLRRIPLGLDQVRVLAPNAIVLDLRLPGLGGMELVRLLAADRQLRRTPVVICSGADDLTSIYRQELTSLGCEIVPKPFELEDLIGSVRRAVWSSQSCW